MLLGMNGRNELDKNYEVHSERLAQASGKITSVEAFFLRSIASNWIGVSTCKSPLCPLCAPKGNEATTAQFDREFAELRKHSEG